MKEHLADCINKLGEFCGDRALTALTKAELYKAYGIEQADVMVLFGGSILVGGEVFAEAMKAGIAKTYIIVGGEGHTTEALRINVQKQISEIKTEGLPEAKVFAAYIKKKYNLEPNFLECKSTNCGNNIINLLELLKENNITFHNIILIQDATMQKRMEVGFKKYITDEIAVINFAAYQARVAVRDSELIFENNILGMWDMERYITLLMGEIPRLLDNTEGYGPNGKNFIAHVDIPMEVKKAFLDLQKEYSLIREAGVN